jgi:hypothetical protein
MNPIKTPQEMMAELAGIPRMAGGGGAPGRLTAGASAIYNNLVKKATAVKRAPLNAKELAIIEQHAASLSRPTSTGVPTQPGRLEATTPAANNLVDQQGNAYRAVQGPRGLTTPEQAKGYDIDPFGMSPANMRAREEIIDNKPVSLYDNNVKAFEDRDPFLTEAMTGRKPSGTYQKPFTTNVDDLAAQNAQLESKGVYGNRTATEPGDMPTQSTTPSADYFAQMSTAAENRALPDNIISELRKQLGRQPTEDEINAYIANLNVLGMDYTGKGASVFGLRPAMPSGRPTKEQQAGINAWKQKAIDSGQSRSAVDASGSDLRNRYPSLQREVEYGPEPEFKNGGSTTPEDMRHMMLAYGQTPQKYKEGNSVVGKAKDAYKNMSGFNKFVAAVGPADVAYELSQKRPGGAAMSALETVAGATMPFFKGFAPLMMATYASDLGDGTLDAYNAKQQAELAERLSKSPVFLQNNMTPINNRDQLGRSPSDRALAQYYQEEGQNLMKYTK